MPLKMRPTGLGSGIDKDRPDYTVYCGGWRTARCMIRPQYEPRRWPMARSKVKPKNSLPATFVKLQHTRADASKRVGAN